MGIIRNYTCGKIQTKMEHLLLQSRNQLSWNAEEMAQSNSQPALFLLEGNFALLPFVLQDWFGFDMSDIRILTPMCNSVRESIKSMPAAWRLLVKPRGFIRSHKKWSWVERGGGWKIGPGANWYGLNFHFSKERSILKNWDHISPVQWRLGKVGS